MNVLIALNGLEEPQAKETVGQLQQAGARMEDVHVAHTKMGVLQACQENTGIEVVLVTEYLESASPYTARELDEIDEMRAQLRIIPVLRNEHKGSTYVRELHAAAIYNALFEEDAYPANVASLIMEGRNKRDARSYYGIQDDKEGLAEGLSDADVIKSSLQHALYGGGMEGFVGRVEYVHSRLSPAEFYGFLTKLPAAYRELLKVHERFADYFLDEPDPVEKEPERNEGERITIKAEKAEKRILPVRIPIPVLKRRESVQYISVTKECIAVISMNHGVGSTFVAKELAKTLACEPSYQPVIVQLPETSDCLYEELGFDRIFGERYVSHMYEYLKDGKVPTQENEYEGIQFVLPDKKIDSLDKWSYVKNLRLLSALQGTAIILDMGAHYHEKFYKSILQDCKFVLCVIDGSQCTDPNKLNALKAHINALTSTHLIFAVNRHDQRKDYNAIAGGNDIVYIREFTDRELRKRKNGFLYPFLKHSGLEQAALSMGYEIGSGKNIKKLKSRDIQKKYIKKGVTEIGFAGVTYGVGLTHTAVMCAICLSASHRVAYVEANAQSHIASFLGMMDKNGEGCVTAYGIDFFSCHSYKSFAVSRREDYEYVVVDYGIYGEMEREEYFRMDKRFVIAAGAEWRLLENEDFIRGMSVQGSFDVLVPFISRKAARGIRKVYDGYEVYLVPFNETAFLPADDVRYLFSRIVDETVEKGEGGPVWKMLRK